MAEDVKIRFTAENLDAILTVTKELDNLIKDLEKRGHKVNLSLNTSDATRKLDDFSTRLSRLQTKIVDFGSRMQSLGRAITTFTSPFTRIFTGMAYRVGFSAVSKIMNGLSGAFERYDTMKTYSRSLEVFGFDAEEASEAVKKLRDSVLGLPTGLDEIVALQKKFAATSRDIQKSTNLAIATNNAYIAENTQARQKKVVERSFAALVGGAELADSTWDALFRALPMSFGEVARELGYADDNLGNLVQDIKDGNVTAEQFLDTFIKLGNEGGVISNAANVVKTTFNALSENITNATKRMGEGIIESLDKVFMDYNGRNLVQNLLGFDSSGKDIGDGIKDWINGLAEGIKTWIEANPERIISFFEKLKSIDWVGLIKGVADIYLPIVEKMVDIMSRMDMEKLSKFMVIGNFIGRGLTLFGGFTKGTAGMTAFAGMGFAGVLGKIVSLVKRAGSAKNAAKAVESIGSVGKAASTMIGGWQGVANKALTIAAIPTIAGSIWLAAKALQEIDKVDLDWGHLINTLGQMAVAIGSIGALAAGIGALLVAGGPVSWITAIGVGTGVATIVALTGAIASIAKSLETVSKVELPTKGKIDAVMDSFGAILPAIQDVVRTLAGNQGMIVGWTKKSEAKSAKSIVESFNGILEAFVGMTDNLNKIAGAKNIGKQLKSAAKKIEAIGEGLQPLKSAIMKAFGSYEQTFVEGDTVTTQTRYKKFEESAASEYEKMTESLGNIFSNIAAMVDMFLKMREKINGILGSSAKKESKVNFDKFRENMQKFIHEMNALIMGDGSEDNLYTLGQNAKFVKDNGIANISSAFTSIGEVVTQVQDISGKVDIKEWGADLSRVNTVIRGISNIAMLMVNDATFPNGYFIGGKLDRLGEMFDKLARIPSKIRLAAHMLGTGLDNDLNKLKEFFKAGRFNGFEDVIVSTHVIFDVDFGDSTVTVYKAVWDEWERICNLIDTMNLMKTRVVDIRFVPMISGVDAVIRAINAAHSAINEALRWTLIPKNRTVTVNLNQKVNRKYPASYYEHNGGMIYRAGGGSIFKPRGTDTVPAMLTPGEYVMNRNAVNAFGKEFMQRVNNLDISGALRELYARVGNTMANSQKTIINNNHIDNRTYSNTQHINTNNANFAFRRSRWVSELR